MQGNKTLKHLFRTRKNLENLAKLESEGQSFWTSAFSQEAKNKIIIAFMETTRQNIVFQEKAREFLLKDLGKFSLVDSTIPKYADFQEYFIKSSGVEFVSVIEACQLAIEDPTLHEYRMYIKSYDYFSNEVNRILIENRISYKLHGAEMIEHKSQLMFTNILEPILIHTSKDESLLSINKAFLEAIEELSIGKHANAITDASRALEESLRYIGAKGNGPGELFNDARSKGFLKPHDQPLFEVLNRAVGWVSAQRANEGDAHRQTEPVNSEAWATIYICGALILKILNESN